MELFELRYIYVLAAEKNFSRAAEKLFISQSSLSQQIKKIEKEAGFPIFERSSRSVSLTPQGESLLEYAEKVLSSYDDFETALKNIKDRLSHKIKFGSSQFIGPVISQVMSDFKLMHPKTNLDYMELFNKDLINAVKQSEIDLAVAPLIEDFDKENRIQSYTIRKEYICAIIHESHPLALKSEISLEELTHYQLIFSSIRTGLKQVIFNAFDTHGLSASEPFDITSEATRIPFLKGGAITFSLSGIHSWVDNNDMLCIPVYPRLYVNISLILPQTKKITPPLRDLMSLLTDAIKNSPTAG